MSLRGYNVKSYRVGEVRLQGRLKQKVDPTSVLEGLSARNLPLLYPKPYGIGTRPVVAWAVLQRPSSFVK